MSTRNTDDYPIIEDEELLEKGGTTVATRLDARAGAAAPAIEPGPYAPVAEAERAAREPLETEHDDHEAEHGDNDQDDDVVMVRRAEVRLDPIFVEDPGAEIVSLELEEFADGSSELVVFAVDGSEGASELARVDAATFFAAIDRLRAFAANPNPPRERTLGDVHAALERAIGDAGPVISRAIGNAFGVPPLRPVPGGRK